MITYRANNSYCPWYGIPARPMDSFGGWGSTPVPKDTVIEYTLDKLDHALLFQIHYQNPAVKAALKNGKFRASNGLTIDISNAPEAKISEWTVYLRGNKSRYDSIPDITTFTHNYKRDNAYKAVKLAIKEFAAAVRKATNYQPISFGIPFGIPVQSGRGNSPTTCFCW